MANKLADHVRILLKDGRIDPNAFNQRVGSALYLAIKSGTEYKENSLWDRFSSDPAVKIAGLLMDDERTDPNIVSANTTPLTMVCSEAYNDLPNRRNKLFELLYNNPKTDPTSAISILWRKEATTLIPELRGSDGSISTLNQRKCELMDKWLSFKPVTKGFQGTNATRLAATNYHYGLLLADRERELFASSAEFMGEFWLW